jgi:hypothetical protein
VIPGDAIALCSEVEGLLEFVAQVDCRDADPAADGVAGLLRFPRISDLIARFSKKEKGGWKLPDYSELRSGQ